MKKNLFISYAMLVAAIATGVHSIRAADLFMEKQDKSKIIQPCNMLLPCSPHACTTLIDPSTQEIIKACNSAQTIQVFGPDGHRKKTLYFGEHSHLVNNNTDEKYESQLSFRMSAAAPVGNQFIVGTTDGSLVLLNQSNKLKKIYFPKKLKTGIDYVLPTNDENFIANRYSGATELWEKNSETGAYDRSIIIPENKWFTALQYLKGLGLVGAEFASNDVQYWNLTGKLLKTYEGHSASVSSIALGAKEKVLAGARDGSIRIWSPNGTLLKATEARGTETKPEHWVTALCTSEKNIYAGHGNGTIEVMDEKGNVIKTLATEGFDSAESYARQITRLAVLTYDKTRSLIATNGLGTSIKFALHNN